MNQKNILQMELSLSRYFTMTRSDIPVKAKDVMQAVKMQGVKKADIKAARKNLGIVSEEIDGEYFWYWGADATPDEVWAAKNNEVWEGINQCGNQN